MICNHFNNMAVLDAILIKLMKSTLIKHRIFLYEPSTDFFLTGKNTTFPYCKE